MGLYKVPSHGGVAPHLQCTVAGRTSRGVVYTTSTFTEEKKFKSYTWHGVPFSYFDARCDWSEDLFSPGNPQVLWLSGSHNVTGIVVSCPEAPTHTATITACVSQYHSRPSARLAAESLEYYRLLGVRRFVLYDFGDNGADGLALQQLYAGSGTEIVLVDWAPVQRYPSWLRGQVLALNHCLRSSRPHSPFVLNVDLDEYLLPVGRLEGALAAEAQRWARATAPKQPVVLFASFDFAPHCRAIRRDSNPLRLHAPRLRWRSPVPDHFSDGPRRGWDFYFAGGPRDGVGGGRGKWLASTAASPDLHASVHTFFGDYHNVTVLQPEMAEWRVLHFRNLFVRSFCAGTPGAGPGPEPPTMKVTYHPPGAANHEARRVLQAIEDNSLLQALPSLTAFISRSPKVVAFLEAGEADRLRYP
eukprot:EG_transcript_7671